MTRTQQRKPTIHEEVTATLERLEAEDPGLQQFLKKAYGYAVFPSVGKAALVLGGAYGRGEVFEQGKLIGYATIAQTTIGVQIGGDTFSEVIAFESKAALDRFKKGKFAFAANASAVLVKAGAGGTADYEKGVSVFAYAEGGMLLEAAIGGQRFKFKPLGDEKQQSGKAGKPAKAAKGGSSSRGGGQDEEEQEDSGGEGLMSRAGGGVRDVVSKVTEVVKEHPVVSTVVGVAALGGIALLVTRAVRGSSGGSSDGSQGDEGEGSEARDEMNSGSEEEEEDRDESGEEDAGEEERDDDREDQYDEQDEDADEDEGEEEESDESDESDEEDAEDEEPEATPRRSRSRSRSRA